MPPRPSKRQQRERAELDALASVKSDHISSNISPNDESSGDEEKITNKRNLNASFAALLNDLNENENSDSDASERESRQVAGKKSKKTKKKKKKTSEIPASASNIDNVAQILENPEASKSKSAVDGITESSPAIEASIPTPTKQAKKERKKERRKAAAKGADDVDVDSDVEILKQLTLKNLNYHYTPSSSSSKVQDQAPTSHSYSSSSSSSALNTLLAVSAQHLDSDAEMRKFFGSRVIDSISSQPQPSPSSRHGRRIRTQPTKSKSVLTKPTNEWWPPAMREGLSCRVLSPDEVEQKRMRAGSDNVTSETGEKWYTVEYTKKYLSVTKMFLDGVMSGDPERLYRVLGKLPYHADTLLQLADVYRHQEEHSRNADFLSRALFAYERAFVGTPLSSFATGDTRLDFDRVENRVFYLAVGRIVVDLHRRGTLRSAFEFSRLLFSLDPYTDPQGSLLYLDYLAIKAGMEKWLVEMWNVHDLWAKEREREDGKENMWGRFNVTGLPGWAYARALALRELENIERSGVDDSKTDRPSDIALREAILSFPSVVPLVADKADINLPSSIRAERRFRIEPDGSNLSSESERILHLLSHLYAFRSSSIWKIPANASWLSSTVISVSNSPSAKSASRHLHTRFLSLFPSSTHSSLLSFSIYRHVLITLSTSSPPTAQQLISAFFPAEVKRGSYLACDPLPPKTKVSSYDEAFFGNVSSNGEGEGEGERRRMTRREREVEERMLARLVGDRGARDQLRAVFDANPIIRERFPGGIVQFAQMAAELPEQFWDDLVMAAQGLGVGNEGGGGGEREMEMPGGMIDLEFVNLDGNQDENVEVDPQQARVDDHDEDSESETGEEPITSDEDENQPPLPARIIRGLINRFWGFTRGEGANAAPESDSDSDENQPVTDDVGGVD